MTNDTYAWLRELGAVRPMAPARDQVLALGAWVEGHYPIQWREIVGQRLWDEAEQRYRIASLQEEWRLFGVPCAPLDRETCERIIAAIEAAEKGA